MIQTCRSDCRHHAANDADETKDDRGQGQAPHIDVKMDIAGLQIQGQSLPPKPLSYKAAKCAQKLLPSIPT